MEFRRLRTARNHFELAIPARIWHHGPTPVCTDADSPRLIFPALRDLLPMIGLVESQVSGKQATRAALWPGVWRGLLVGILAALGVEAWRVNVGQNFHVLIPGRVYRCGQLSGTALEKNINSYGIRTVVNLRGCCDPQGWYLDECRASHHESVSQEDIALSAGRLPSTSEIRRLLEVLDCCEYPILMHCRQGKDRTGLASAAVLLLQTDTPLDQARYELSLRYGHLAAGRPANLDRFFDLYSTWLSSKNLQHSNHVFRDYLEHGYCPGECLAQVEAIDWPARIERNSPTPLKIRCQNESVETWRMRPGLNAGVHAAMIVWDADGKMVASTTAGLFQADVRPGEQIDLVLALPALRKPGRYQAMVDLGDMRHCWFYQAGGEPLERDLTVE
jgi:hypothetical protein